MRSIKHLVFIAMLITLIGCGSSNKLFEYDVDNCATVLEGNFFSKPIYKHYAPAILFPRSNDVWIVYGKVIEYSNEGVYVKKKKSGLLGSSDTLFFRYQEMRAIVDSNNICIWGELKENEKMDMTIHMFLEKKGSPDYSPIFLELTPNINFSYCIEPGKYDITKMVQYTPALSANEFYLSIPSSIAEFEVMPGVVNYIGDIDFLDETSTQTPNYTIPYKKQLSSSGVIFVPTSGGVVGAAIVGGLMGLLVNVTNASADSCGTFKMRINHNPQYIPKHPDDKRDLRLMRMKSNLE